MFTSHALTNLTLTANLSSLSRLGVTIIVEGGRGGGTSCHRVKLALGRNQVMREESDKRHHIVLQVWGEGWAWCYK